MSADPKELTRESSANGDQSPADPFAVDVFASPNDSSETSGLFAMRQNREQGSPPANPIWSSRLPRVTSDALQASEILAGLPVETYTQIHASVVSVLSQYSITPAEQISISLIDLNESDFAIKAPEPDGPPGVFATFTTQLSASSFSFELEASFAVRLIDRMLGGDGEQPASLRSLTKTERAVIEFLCLSAAAELNAQTGEPLLSVQSIADQPPWWTSRIPSAATPIVEVWRRGLVASLRIAVGDITGIIRAYLAAGSLPALNEINRRLQVTHDEAGIVAYADKERVRYERVAPELGLTVLIGETYVTVPELADLESGDVMVVEKPSVRWREQRIVGSLLLRVGDADATLITGEVSEIDGANQPEASVADTGTSEPAPTPSLKVRVGETVIAPLPRFPERLKMEEELENAEAPAEGASLIEAVMLTVRVELAARRLRLDELSRLRRSQILDLQCKATDPVDLIVDGRKIASGELVDIDGRLGVQITQVLV
jgi:type III secretion system YscQ/HrcQ family protein